MNLDDLLCVGATDRFLLANAIGRHTRYIPGQVLKEIVAGYADFCRLMGKHGVKIVATGGETADLPDNVRTILVDAGLATRLRRDQVVDNDRIQPGDVIVGLSSTGQATYETRPNSGIGSNGLTLARHVLLSRHYVTQYPETIAPEHDKKLVYRGPYKVDDHPENLGMSVGEALCSPTRTYAPIVKKVLAELGKDVHGMVHNTGGGLTKSMNFGQQIDYIKDDLFPTPPLFQLLAEVGKIQQREMLQTFNMGHRFEIYVPEAKASAVIAASQSYGIEAKVIGRCKARTGAAKRNAVTIVSPEWGTHHF